MGAFELEKTILKNNANLKAYYRFEGNSADVIGSFNGTDSNMSYSSGKYGDCAVFNGSTGYIQFPSLTSIFNSISAFTITLWVNATDKSYGAGEGKIFDIRGSGTGYLIFRVNSTNFNFYLFNGTEAQFNVARTVGQWIHVAYVYDGSNLRGYINGNQVGSASRTGTVSSGNFGCLGREYNASATSQFDGKMDDLAIFSTALSADQIKELYEGRFIGEAWPQSGLVAGYHLNGSSTDFSGNNNHGTDTAVTYSQANGKFGKGAGFNGSSSQILCSGVTGASVFSIFLWSKWTTLVVNKYLLARRSAANNANYNIQTKSSDGSIQLSSYNGSTAGTLDSSIIPSTGIWYHICAVFNGTSSQIFVNGNLVSSGGTIQTHTSGTDVSIASNSGSAFYSGALEEVLIFNRALTASEIRKMYAVGTGKYF